MWIFFCLAALCATTRTITTCNGFQHQSQSQLKLPSRQHHQSQSRSWNQPVPTKTPVATTTTTSSSSSQLNALPGLSSDPLGALAVLAGIVIVHESGHYLAARTFNISVEEFSIGFGPKIFGFEKFGNEFNLRALPLGGYVRFPENFDSELLQENEQIKRDARSEIRQIEREQNIQKEWNLKEEVLNAVTLGYWNERKSDNERKQRLIERKERVEANKLELESIPWWKRLFVKTTSASSATTTNNNNNSNGIDKIYEVLDNSENFEIEYSDDPQLLQNRPWQERAVVLSGGVIFNLLLAFGIYFGEIGPLGGSGLPRAVFDDGVIVAQSPRSGGPSDGFLRKGDIITGINGTYFFLFIPLSLRS
jgi:membrane-associated protease RseP (regulator of RpoE activity)